MRLFSFNLIPLLLYLSISHLLVSSSSYNNISFHFPSSSSDHNNFIFSTAASLSQGALLITPDTRNNISRYLLNHSGRIPYFRSFRLWDYNRIASFNTSFSINIYRRDSTIPAGEGFAFLIAPDADGPPPGSDGRFLGLTNSSTDGLSSNRIVTVEFDTLQQGHDRDDNHVGLDINGVDSKISYPLSQVGIQIAPAGTVNHTVWIDYDGRKGRIEDYMSRKGEPKLKIPVLAGNLNLRDYVNQSSYFGFAGATGADNYELNCVLEWNLIVENLEDDNPAPMKSDKKGGWKIWTVIAAGVGVTVVAGAAMALIWYSKQRKRKKMAKVDQSMLSTLRTLPGMPREFEYEEMRNATNDFDESMKLGQGGFGIVYKGVC